MDDYTVPVDDSEGSKEPQGSSWTELTTKVGRIEWVWDKWLPLGFLTILAAESGAGKSAVLLRLVGCFTNGWDFPDGSQFTRETGSVLWCESEASQALNVERANKWGIKIDRIITPFPDPLQDVSLEDPLHKEAIRNHAMRPEILLIVIDSLSGANRQDENSVKMLPIVKWIAELARDTNKPFLLTHHLRKRGVQESHEVTIDRLRGSSSIIQPARVVWAIDKPIPNVLNKRLKVLKSNIGKMPDPIGILINEDGVTFGEAPRPIEKVSKIEKAKRMITKLLQGGPVDSTEMEKKLTEGGIAKRTWDTAKAELKINPERIGGKDGKWVWELPKPT